jgi:hypothetical protein
VGIDVTGLTNMSQESLELVDGGPDEPGRSVPLNLDDEYVGVATVFELDTSVYGMATPEPMIVSYRTGLQVGDIPE